jgi:hypothetical protein
MKPKNKKIASHNEVSRNSKKDIIKDFKAFRIGGLLSLN